MATKLEGKVYGQWINVGLFERTGKRTLVKLSKFWIFSIGEKETVSVTSFMG